MTLRELEQRVQARNGQLALPGLVADDTRRDAMDYLMGAVREALYLGSSPPAHTTPARDAAQLKRLLKVLPRTDAVYEALLGVRLLCEDGTLEPMAKPGDQMAARILNVQWSDRPVWRLATERFQREAMQLGMQELDDAVGASGLAAGMGMPS